jgi:hypothetical protein
MRKVPYVENTLLHELKQWTVPQFDAIQLAQTGVQIPVRQMGITHPTIVEAQLEKSVIYLKDGPGSGDSRQAVAGGDAKRQPLAGPGGPIRNKPAKPPKTSRKEKEGEDEGERIPLTEFVIEFAWVYIPPEKRAAEDPGIKKAETAAPPGATPSAGTAPATPAATTPPAAAKPAAAGPPGATGATPAAPPPAATPAAPPAGAPK